MDFFSNGITSFCESIKKVDTKLLFCEQFDEKSKIWNFNRHKHECIEILYFLYGNAEVTASEEQMSASFYDVVIYPRQTYHTEHLQFDHHQEIICLWVDIPELVIPNVIHIQDAEGDVKWIFEKLVKEHKRENPSTELIDYYIKIAAIHIARKSLVNDASHDSVSIVTQYMQDHMSENIIVDDLAELIFVSKSYLSRVFKKKTGMSLIEYLRFIRIAASKNLLVTTDKTVEEITYLIGYNSPKYFCRAFRSLTGMSPREYKNSEKAFLDKADH